MRRARSRVCDECWHNITRGIRLRGSMSAAAQSALRQPTWCKLPPDKFSALVARAPPVTPENILLVHRPAAPPAAAGRAALPPAGAAPAAAGWAWGSAAGSGGAGPGGPAGLGAAGARGRPAAAAAGGGERVGAERGVWDSIAAGPAPQGLHGARDAASQTDDATLVPLAI